MNRRTLIQSLIAGVAWLLGFKPTKGTRVLTSGEETLLSQWKIDEPEEEISVSAGDPVIRWNIRDYSGNGNHGTFMAGDMVVEPPLRNDEFRLPSRAERVRQRQAVISKLREITG